MDLVPWTSQFLCRAGHMQDFSMLQAPWFICVVFCVLSSTGPPADGSRSFSDHKPVSHCTLLTEALSDVSASHAVCTRPANHIGPKIRRYQLSHLNPRRVITSTNFFSFFFSSLSRAILDFWL
jgi:hypothetical protein